VDDEERLWVEDDEEVEDDEDVEGLFCFKLS
jgi:hypothetical protein